LEDPCVAKLQTINRRRGAEERIIILQCNLPGPFDTNGNVLGLFGYHFQAIIRHN